MMCGLTVAGVPPWTMIFGLTPVWFTGQTVGSGLTDGATLIGATINGASAKYPSANANMSALPFSAVGARSYHAAQV
jgi:hypothetical protein